MDDCIFCDIATGTSAASRVHEDDQVLAFLDAHPVNPGHLLVIPRVHYASLGELPEDVGARMFVVAQRVAESVRRSGVRCDGISLALSDGEAAGQDVFHCHLHVRPRVRVDSWRATYQPVHQTRQEMDALAERIASAYRDLYPESASPSESGYGMHFQQTGSLSIRGATAMDLPVLSAMNKRLIEDEGSRNPMSVEQLQTRMADWLGAGWEVVMLESAGQIAGYAVYQVRKDEYYPERDAVYLRQFYIERGFRGRGLGAEAFWRLTRDRFPGECEVLIDVLSGNPRGHRFWERLGFQPYYTAMRLHLSDSRPDST